MILYLNEPGSVLRKSGGKYVIEIEKAVVREVPMEKLEAVVLFSGTHVTSPCMMSLCEKGVPITWLSSTGKFFGRVESTQHVNIQRYREQFRRSENDEFCIELARSFVLGKIRNSIVLLRRYNRNLGEKTVNDVIKDMARSAKGLKKAGTHNTIYGIEGYSSRIYFQALAEIVRDEFRFSGRSKRPPKDPFNALISFGYTLLMYEIYTALVNRGLNPYIGFLHRIRQGHPALASDLMEEWRPVLIDSLAMFMVQGGSIKLDDFTVGNKEGAVYLRKDRSRVFIKKFEERLRSEQKYISTENPLSFREAISHQVLLLVKSIENKDPGLYRPIWLR